MKSGRPPSRHAWKTGRVQICDQLMSDLTLSFGRLQIGNQPVHGFRTKGAQLCSEQIGIRADSLVAPVPPSKGEQRGYDVVPTPPSDYACRHATNDGKGRNVLADNRTGGNHGTRSNGYPRQERDAITDPNRRADRDILTIINRGRQPYHPRHLETCAHKVRAVIRSHHTEFVANCAKWSNFQPPNTSDHGRSRKSRPPADRCPGREPALCWHVNARMDLPAADKAPVRLRRLQANHRITEAAQLPQNPSHSFLPRNPYDATG